MSSPVVFVALFTTVCLTQWSVSRESESRGRKEGREEEVWPSSNAPRWFEPAGTCVAFTCSRFFQCSFLYGDVSFFKCNLFNRFVQKFLFLFIENSSPCLDTNAFARYTAHLVLIYSSIFDSCFFQLCKSNIHAMRVGKMQAVILSSLNTFCATTHNKTPLFLPRCLLLSSISQYPLMQPRPHV